jgi:GDP-L-fucose synthase
MENLQIQNNVIGYAHESGVRKLLFLGSSCIFPKAAPQPITEEALLTSPLEPTNEGYAIAKIAGLKLCEYLNRQQGVPYISLMPCNLYGYNDNFDLVGSHFLPALIRKFYEAKRDNAPSVTVWGTGTPLRELMFVDDLARACVFAMNNYSSAEFLNVGYGEDYSIAEYAQMVKEISGYKGEIVFDTTKPDGMARKIMDSSKIRKLGWKPEVALNEGIRRTYKWYEETNLL